MSQPSEPIGAAGTGPDDAAIARHLDRVWDEDVLPTLEAYIRIPAKSPNFDSRWRENGHLERAATLIEGWARTRDVRGLAVEVVRLDGRTPLLYMEAPAAGGGEVALIYGHFDKQPEMTGWREGLGPWTPVREGDRLYGRGAGDDGYAAFAALAAIEALQRHGGRHGKLAVVIEAAEESGSADLPAYMEMLRPRIGVPGLVIALDSGCGNYEQLWVTTSLRGNLTGVLSVEILKEGVHSGDASGVVPSSFRILRQVLSRLEDQNTGKILLDALHAPIPQARIAQAKVAAQAIGEQLHARFPFVAGAGPVTRDLVELILNRTWRPALAVTGQAGLPAVIDGGNVLRPTTAFKLSLRVPPTCDPNECKAAVHDLLTRDPPYGARVKLAWDGGGGGGWNGPPVAAWLERAANAASLAYFGKHAVAMGEGGTIPFMDMLARQYPEAQFLITGVLGPQANAHGPNEFLHVPTAKRLTGAVAHVLDAHARRSGRS